MFTAGTAYIVYIGVIVLFSVNPGSPYKKVYREYLEPTPVYNNCRKQVIEKSELLIIKSFNNGVPVIRKLVCNLVKVNR